ncbi:KasA/KasB family beta-ketoacyl-ACP synthase [Mycobacterium sp. 1274761.0]|uniref:KasA/KasB family beta-ketoacyl-ACP synthase n=1 Tax=Mycobacterium sp. 1274761.0 TaxID=1834077 RepID=UPI0007FEFFA4|nr:KasA/KasB family beta-ketoacyl-ACP synthase [Mycobacterium sp. 1274761.0]OBK72974.1 beta-ketoacyl-[acyl-carrier-protein] synthase II [Mycobacterium sp. 1274761.0]
MTGNGGRGRPDVVVTAIESTTSLAPNAEDTWRQLLDGRSGIRTLEKPFLDEFDLEVRIGGELREDFDDHLSRVEVRRMSYMQKMAAVLGRRLWEKAGSPEVEPRRLAVSVGQALASTQVLIGLYQDLKAEGMRAVRKMPLVVQMHMPNAPAAAIGLDHKARAGIMSPVLSDASGAAAIQQGWQHIVFGDADVAICGGVEARIEAVPVATFSVLGMLSTNNSDPEGASRPFDKNRDGMVLGEGGALMLLETEEHAKARGADILARVLGAAVTYDGHHDVAPEPSGEMAGEAVTRAIRQAALQPADIDHVNANASGTIYGDLAEARALRAAFGTHRPAVYAPKAALGHSLGSAGAIEAVLTVQALRDGVAPPTLNVTELDSEIELDVIVGEPRRSDYRYAVSPSFGVGGHNVALVFGAY